MIYIVGEGIVMKELESSIGAVHCDGGVYQLHCLIVRFVTSELEFLHSL